MIDLLRSSTLGVLLFGLLLVVAPVGQNPAHATAPAASLDVEPLAAGDADPIELDDDLEALRTRFEAEIERLRAEFRRELERAQESGARGESRELRQRLEELERENAELRRALRAMRAEAGGRVDAPPRRVEAPPAGERPRGQLGVSLAPTDPELATALKVSVDNTFQVNSVQENSAAARMRLRAGDVITGFDGKSGNLERFIEHMQSKRAGDELVLTYARRQSSGETLRITGRTELLPWRDPNAAAAPGDPGSVPAIRLVPMPPPPVEPPTPARRGVSFGVSVVESDGGNGVVITDLTPKSNAAVAALAVNDRLTKFGERKIAVIEDLRAALSSASAGQEVTIGFVRGDTAWQSRVRLAGNDGGAALLSGPDRVRSGGTPPVERGRGFLGVLPEEVDNGLTISEVVAGSSAAAMGLAVGDRLVSLNGTRVRTIDDLRNALSALSAGDEIRVVYRREGSRQVAEGTLGTPPDDGQSSAPASGGNVATASGSVGASTVVSASGGSASGSGSGSTASGSGSASGKAPAEAPRPGTLGIVAEEISGSIVISELPRRSAAAAAGARVGDRITRIQGVPVQGFDTIVDTLARHSAGSRISLTVERDGRPIDLRVTLAAPAGKKDETSSRETGSRETGAQGVAEPVAAVAPAPRPYLGVEVEERADGVWVVAVEPKAPALAAGLQVGDRVLTVAGKDVIDIESMRRAVLSLSVDASAPFTVLRQGTTTELEVTPEPR